MHKQVGASRERYPTLAVLQNNRCSSALESDTARLAMTRRHSSPTRMGRGVSVPGLARKATLESVSHAADGGSEPSWPALPRVARALRSLWTTDRFLAPRLSLRCSGLAPLGPAALMGGKSHFFYGLSP